MKFSLDRDTFAKVLKKVDGVCSNRGTSFLILNSCMIEARKNTITVTGTDLEITLRVVETANVIEDGAVLVNARRLLDTVQNQAPGCEILMTSDGSQVRVEAGNFNSRILSGDVSEYPQISNIEIKSSLSMGADTFKRLIDKTMFSISRDDARPEFTGAFLTISQNGTIQLVSTDGHRLSKAEDSIKIVGSLPGALEKGVIIPRKGLAELTKNMSDGEVSIDVSSNKFIVKTGGITFYINPISGQFPDFSKVVPSHLEHKAVVRREDLQQSLKRASIYASKAGTIRVAMMPGRLDIAAYDPKTGEMRDSINAEYQGSGMMAGFNWRYIDEILQVIDGDSVSFEIIDMDSPAVVRDLSTDKLDFIVMPMQL